MPSERKPYRPSNGTEGEWFDHLFCARCWRDRKFRQTEDAAGGCPIIAAALSFSIDHPLYPPEWIEDAAGPRCTAFSPIKGPRVGKRKADPRQGDLFAALPPPHRPKRESAAVYEAVLILRRRCGYLVYRAGERHLVSAAGRVPRILTNEELKRAAERVRA